MTVGSQVKQCYATIKLIEASLQELSVKTQDEQAKQSFQEAAELITQTKEDLNKQVVFIMNEEPQYKN